MYDLPSINNPKQKISPIFQNKIFQILVIAIVFFAVVFYCIEFLQTGYLHNQVDFFVKGVGSRFLQPQELPIAPSIILEPETKYISNISYEQAVIDSVASASPSVVSIMISKNVPVYEQQFVDPFGDIPGFESPFELQIQQKVQKGTKYQEIGAGSGFIVSEDGLVLTNKHVVSDKTADYTVLTNDGKKYPAKVSALDPVQDLAIIKIQVDKLPVPAGQNPADVPAVKFPSIKIGNSDGIQIGQGVIAIGNALGQFSNTVSVGVVSGLGRTVSASGSKGFSETLEGIIQTDAAINLGNSGGPLVNLKGEVIGVNTAMADGAQSIGFAIPINIAKKDIEQIIKTNKIVYPFLGVRYISIDEKVKEKYGLSVDQGAFILKGDDGEPAIIKGSAAEKAGLKEKDVVLELNGEKITKSISMQQIITRYDPQDRITLKILRNNQELDMEVVLGER